VKENMETLHYLLSLAIVVCTPPLFFWLIIRPTKAAKAVQDNAAE
jgi:hypothetical protein